MTVRLRLALLLLLCSATFSTLAQTSILGQANAVRIGEAQRLLSWLKQSDDWSWEDAPFAVLLLTEERDFLVGHPSPTDDFVSEGVDPVLGMDVFSRPRTEGWSLQFLATFPAVAGVPTVVVGTAEATGLTSTAWVVTLLHEHFHQIQYSWPSYYGSVAALDLDGGDTSGMWMLNYAFPYEDDSVGTLLRELASSLASDSGDTVRILARLKEQLDPADYRYLTFQFWQEGTARYMEGWVGDRASTNYVPSPAFAALPDFVPYAQRHADWRASLSRELEAIDPPAQRRVIMYPLGAALAQRLDAVRPTWKEHYFDTTLSTVRLLDPDL